MDIKGKKNLKEKFEKGLYDECQTLCENALSYNENDTFVLLIYGGSLVKNGMKIEFFISNLFLAYYKDA